MPGAAARTVRLADLTVDVSLSNVARGDLLYQGASAWQNLPAGTSGRFLRTQGAGADPVWADVTVPVAANPTGSVGLSAVNGSASTFMRSDAAPALDVSITPTWTGAHTWSGVTGTVSIGLAANTSSDGFILTNPTSAATGGNQRFSPRLRLTGQGWKTGGTPGSQTVDWTLENQPVQGSTSPSTNLVVSYQVNGGGYTSGFTFASDGSFSLAGTKNLWLTPGQTRLYAPFNGAVFLGNAANNGLYIDGIGTAIPSIHQYKWTNSSTNAIATTDTGLGRNAAGVVEVNNSTAGQWGGLKAGFYGSATSSIADGLTLGTRSSGTPAAGLGAALLVNLDSSTTADRNAGRLAYQWATATDASRKARGTLTVYDTAEREAIRWEASGSAAMLGFFGTAAAVQDAGWSVTGGYTADRAFNPESTTLTEVARALGTLVDALKTYGLLGG